jgi:hypothetical protein
LKCIYFFSQDGIFYRHVDYRPQRITRDEHKILALQAREINNSDSIPINLRVVEMICLWESKFPASENYFQLHQLMDLILFHDGAQIFKRSVHVEGFQDVWPFDRLPYVDLAHNSSPPPEENQRKEG